MGDQLERTIEVVAELREVLTEGRALLKDLAQERKRCEKVVKRAETIVEEMVQQQVPDLITETVEKEMGEFTRVVGEHVELTHAAVERRFDELTNYLLYGNKQGRGRSLVEIAEDHGKLPYQLIPRDGGQES